MSIPQTPSPLSVIVGAKTYNAQWFGGATNEAKITAAIAGIVNDYPGVAAGLNVFVPANMLPYNASLVTFNPNVKMVCEGSNPAVFDIQAYGGDPTGVLDATASLQGAVNGAQALNTPYNGQNLKGGIVECRQGVYVISSTVTVTGNNITIQGQGFAQSASPTTPPTMITAPGGSVTNFNLLTVTGTFCFQLKYIGLQGNNQGTTQGVFGTGCQNHVYDHVFFNAFGLSAIQLSSIGDLMIGCFAENCLKSNPNVDTGVYDLSCTDLHMFDCFATTGQFGAGNIGNGHQYAYAIRNGNCSIVACMGDQSHHGYLVNGIQNRFISCRAFQNQGNGFVVALNDNTFIGCEAISNSQTADNTFAGFKVTNGGNSFTGCIIDGNSGDVRQQSNGFDDSSVTGNAENQINYYSNNRIGANVRGILYNSSGGIFHRFESPHKTAADRGDNSVSITPFVDGDTQFFQTPLTANRTVTLTNNGSFLNPKGSRFRVVRTAAATGASTLTVTGGGGSDSKALTAGQYVDFEVDGSGQWRETAFGSL